LGSPRRRPAPCIAHATVRLDERSLAVRLTTPARAVLTAATAAILVATLRPDYSQDTQSWTGCILCGDRGTADAIVNLILFAPFGLGLALTRIPAWRAILAGALLSAFVELAQSVIPGRDPSLGDVLFNTLGTAAGFGCAVLAPRAARVGPRAAARLSLAAAVLFMAIVTATGGLLQPSYPHSLYYGQWTPNLGHLEWYQGRVLRASVGDISVDSNRLENSALVRSALLRGEPVLVQAVAGPRTPGLASLFSIADDHERSIMLLGPDRDDLVFKYRAPADILGFDKPDVRFVGALGGVRPGDSLTVREWSPRLGRFCLSRDEAVACDLGFSPGDGWALLYYSEWFSPWLKLALSRGWIALLVALVGFWMRKRVESAMALALVGVGLWVLPDLVGLKPAGPVLSLTALLALTLAVYAGNRWSRWATVRRVDPG
jgi:hypothetical protein